MPYSSIAADQQFTGWSQRYDRSMLQRMLFEPSFRLLLSKLDLRPGARVLDVGCGTGNLLAWVADAFPEVELIGIDRCRPMLAQGLCKLGERAEFIQADSQALPLPSRHFDVLLNTHCFHHFPDQAQAAREMFRVLKPGGELLVIDGWRDGPWGHMIYDRLVPAFEGEVLHASRARFRKLFEEAGFEVLRQQRGGWFLPYLLTHCRAPLAGKPAVPAPHFKVVGRSATTTAAAEPLDVSVQGPHRRAA
ncbi:MAG: methyltransferase domain-containing protein [Planctomycetaceae bacterium]|nr:methyltransferase domain-containing protein [Planctomycetaceae bacterium]